MAKESSTDQLSLSEIRNIEEVLGPPGFLFTSDVPGLEMKRVTISLDNC